MAQRSSGSAGSTGSSDARVVLVTGAAGRLGRAVVAAFAERGDRLVLVDREHATLDTAFGPAQDGRRLHLGADLRDAASVRQAVDAALASFGRIDVLCNLAGGFAMGDAVHELDDAAWDAMFDLNARSVLHTARAVVPAMLAQRGGCIVNVGAAAAARGQAHMGAYAASKSVVLRLTESMSAELRGQGVRVNAVLPSILDTPDNRRAMPDADPSTWVAPSDLAKVVRFLASDEARAIHGVGLPVTGLVGG